MTDLEAAREALARAAHIPPGPYELLVYETEPAFFSLCARDADGHRWGVCRQLVGKTLAEAIAATLEVAPRLANAVIRLSEALSEAQTDFAMCREDVAWADLGEERVKKALEGGPNA
jgi:hypothetical protein